MSTDKKPLTEMADIVFNTSIIDPTKNIGTSTDPVDENTTVENEATMSGRLKGEGPGPGDVTVFNPNITTNFNMAYVTKDVLEDQVDTKTGTITWEVKPSTRTDKYGEAILEDTINDDQELLPESFQFYYDGTEIELVEDIAGTVNGELKHYADADDKLVLSITGSAYDDQPKITITVQDVPYITLGKLTYTYKTIGKYFYQTDEVHDYANKVNLTIPREDPKIDYTAESDDHISFGNTMLSKTGSSTFEDNTDYLRYEISVNGNDCDLGTGDTLVTDDISDLATSYILIAADGTRTEVTKDNAGTRLWPYYEIEKSKTEIYVDGKKVDSGLATYSAGANTVNPGSDTNTAVSVKFTGLKSDAKVVLYLKLVSNSEAIKQSNVEIKTKNTANIDPFDNKYSDTFNAVYGTSDAPQPFDSKVITKKNLTKEDASDIRWQILVNPTATQYNRTGGATPLQIQDTLQKGLQFNLGTVKLYQAKYENSEFVKDDEKPVAVTLSKNNFALNSSGCYVMTLDVPQVEGKDVPMILEYSCYAIEKLASADVSNSASLFYDDQEIGKDTQTANIDELSWGKLSTSYRISVIKEDGTVNETTGAVIPVPGVEFALYGSNDDATHSIDETNLVSLGITDVDGNVVFGKLDPSAHYWVKEISDEVEGYKVLEEAVEVMAPAASADSNVMEVTMDNDRTTLDGTITIKKQVEDENKYKDAGTFASYWTTFKLQQKLGDGLAPVDVFFKDGDQGSYEYAGAGSQKREDTDRDEIQLKGSFTQTDDSNEINITALPWGEYYLTETAHQAGTATEKIASHFTVNKDGTVTFDTGIGEEGNATGYKGFVDVNDNTATFVNHATDVTITKKGPDGKGGYEPKAGVKFHLYLEKTNDGGKTWTHENFMPLTWNGNIQPDTVFDTDAEGVLTIRGLGKTQENERYHLQEIPESADTYAADYYFTMSEDGVMTNLGNADPDGDATLGEVTVDNTYDPNHLYGSVVDGKTNNNAVTITNKYGQIKIHKQDQDGTALSGVDFKVSGYDSADSEWKQVGETQTTDSNGELYFNNLKVTEKALAEDGTNNLSNSGLYVYKLEETRPANYFDFGTNNTYYFILDQYGNIIEVTVAGNNVVSVPNDKTTDVIEIDRNYMVIRNVYARMDMQLTKSIAPDKTGATSLLPNAKFDLYQVVGNADYTTSDETAESDDVRMNSTKAGGENHISTDNNGKIQLSALSAETYYYNSGKVDLKTGVPVEYLAADGNYQNYQYYWKEVDTDNVYTVNTADGLGYSVTQAEGSATDSGFKPTDTDQKENMLSETAADKYVDFLKDELTNQTLNAYIKFKKIDASDNSAVGGAVYTLKGPGLDAAGVDITTATKATTGHVTNTQGYTFDAAAFEIPIAIGEGFYGNALAEGTYTLEETTPAPGYTRDTTVYTFTVDDAHANLVILDSDGKVNGKNTTDAGKWESLPLSIQKGDPVDGNTLKDNQLRFNLSKLVFGAAPETALAGCEFTIEPAFGSAFANVDSDKVHSAITLSDSNYILDKTLIADNTYILKETVAAYGYSKLQYPVVFKAGKDGAITLINGSSTHYYNSDAEGEAVGTTVGTDGTVGSNTVVAKVAPEVANGISTAIMKVYDQPIAIYLTKVGQEYNEESSPSASGDKISAAFSIKGDFYDSKNASVASNQTFESLSSTEWDKKDLATVIGDYKFIIGKTYILEETANADAYVLPNSAGSIQFKILDNGGIEWITDGNTYDPKLAVTTLESSDTQNTAKKDQLTIANYKILGSAELIKKDGTGTSANAVKGAKFKLYSYTGTTPSKAAATDTVVGATNGVNTYLGEYTTDNDGKIKAENLPVGKYFFVESFTPAGYVNAAYTDDTYYKFDIVKDADTPKTGIVPTITTFVKGINTAMDTTIATDKVSQAVNTPITGDNKTTLNLFKYDADDTATSKTGLAGAEFELVWNSPDDYTTSETSKVTLKTDAAGALWACAGEDEKWDDEITLIRGTYTLTETKSPAGYALDNGSGEAFSCQFTVTNDDLGNEIMILPAGTTVEANQKVANYVENSIKNAAALTADGVTNTKVKVDLLKVFSPKSSWAMAQFSITPAKGSTFADGKTESKSLSINSSNGFTQTMNGALVVGNTYIIKEFGTHTCYGALRYPILVKVADDGTLSIVSNIGVEDAEGPITSSVTPSDAGKKGKIGETEVVSIAFDSDEKKNTVSITNKTFEAKLLKAGAANTPLAGAEFTLSGGFVDPTTGGDPENITIPVTVGENGLVLDKDNLVVGEKHYLFEANSESVYTLTETKAPAGYELDRTPITFRFNWIGDIVEVQDTNERFEVSTGADKITKNVLTFTDEKIDVSFQKQDMSGNAIKNCGTASFTVTGIMANADGTVGTAASSVAFSLDTSKTLPGSISELSGKLIATETTQDATKYVYTLTETTAPHGYQTISANTGYFTVGTDGTVTVTDESGAAITTNDNLSASGSAITVKDEPIEVTLNKTNASGGAIATGEAIFKITDATTGLPANADHFAGQTSNTVQSIEVTTTNGTIKVSGVLLAGHTYDVTESQAPAGYITRTETLAQIAVAADGTVTVTDKINETDVAGVTVDNTTDAITIADKATAFDVLKVDNAATPTALTGVGLSIFKYVDGKKQEPAVVAEWASGSTAKTITSLEEGVVYGLEETTRLTGYATATPIYFKLEGNVYTGTSKLVQVNADGTKYTGTSSIVEATASGVTNYEIHMTDDKILVPIQVRKVTGMGESAAAVAGATFHIQKKGGTNTDPTWTDLQDTADASLVYHSDNNGYIVDSADERIVLEQGTYRFVEVSVPDDIYLDTTPGDEFTVSEADYTAYKADSNSIKKLSDITNVKMNTSVTLTKVYADDTTTKLAGAEFKLYKGNTLAAIRDENLVRASAYTTAANTGVVTITDLAKGDYVLVETAAPTGYELPTTTVDGKKVEAGFAGTFTIGNDDHDTTINLNGVANGTTTTNRLTPLRDTDSYAAGTGLKNTRTLGIMTLTKKDADDNSGLNGVTFTLYKEKATASNPWEELKDIITGKKYTSVTDLEGSNLATAGQLIVEDLAWGNYKIVETTEKDGYIKTTSTFKFTIDAEHLIAALEYDTQADDSLISNNTITNEKNLLNLSKVSEDATHATLEGSVFTVTMKAADADTYSDITSFGQTYDTGTKKFTTIEDADKQLDGFQVAIPKDGITLRGITNGTYQLTEVTSPVGFHAGAPVVITMKDTGAISSTSAGVNINDKTVQIENKKLQLNIHKINEKSTAQANVTFVIKDSQGTQIGNAFTTDEQGNITSQGNSKNAEFESVLAQLSAGTTYQLVETNPVNGYKVAAPISFRFKFDGAVELVNASTRDDVSVGGNTTANTVTVEDVPATFTITKTLDGESGIANGAVFSLYEIGDTDPFATATSVKGLVTFTGVGHHTERFIIKETKSPDGYELVNGTLGEFMLDVGGNLYKMPTEGADKDSTDVTKGEKVTDNNLTKDNTKIVIGFNKVDTDGNSLGNNTIGYAQFEIKGVFAGEGPDEKTYTVASNDFETTMAGKFIIGNLYDLVETEELTGYLNLGITATFRIKADGTLHISGIPNYDDGEGSYGTPMISGENTDTITYVNRKIVGHVELTKTDDTTAKTPIEGALFDLYKVVEDAAGTTDIDANDIRIARDLPTDGNGKWTTVGNTRLREDAGHTTEALSAGLEAGSYYFKETKTKDNYHNDATQKYSFVVNAANDYVTGDIDTHQKLIMVNVENAPFEAYLNMTKYDLTDGKPIADTIEGYDMDEDGTLDYVGPEFTLIQESAFDVSEETTYVLRTNAQGQAYVYSVDGTPTKAKDTNIKLTKGKYRLLETTEPVGYKQNWSEKDKSDVRFECSFIVTDAENGKTLVIKEGNLSSYDNNQAFALNTTQGSASASYFTSKQDAPEENGVYNQRKTTSVLLNKKDTDGTTALNNAEFLLEKYDVPSNPLEMIKEIMTGKKYDVVTKEGVAGTDGTLEIDNLDYGTYRLTETKSPAGYELNKANANDAPSIIFTIDRTNAGVVQTLAYDNDGITSTPMDQFVTNTKTSIIIDKTVYGSDTKLAGAELSIAPEANHKFADDKSEKTTSDPITWTSTASDSWVITGKLVVGDKYTLTETNRVTGYYDMTGKSVSFHLNSLGQIIIDENQELENKGNAVVVGTGTVAAAKTMTFRNVKIMEKAQLTKSDADSTSTLLNGAVFDVYREETAPKEDTKVQSDLTTGTTGVTEGTDAANGVIITDELPEGDYYFVETKSPNGYELDTRHIEFSIGKDTYNTVLTTATNKKIQIPIYKVDETGRLIASTVTNYADATFEVKHAGENGAAIGTVKTAEDGILTLTGTDYAAGQSYVLTEKSAPEGYILDSTPITFTIATDGKSVTVADRAGASAGKYTGAEDTVKAGIVITNNKMAIDLVKNLTDNLTQADRGYATFKIEGKFADGATKIENLTSENFKTSVTGKMIADQEYTVTETAAPRGYTTIDAFKFTVDSSGNIIKIDGVAVNGTTVAGISGKTLTITDTPVLAGFTKTNQDDKTIARDRGYATFSVTPATGKTFADGTTDAKTVTADGTTTALRGLLIANTNYVLHEITAPQGYELAADVTFSVTEKGVMTVEGTSDIATAAGNTLTVKDQEIVLNLIKTNADASKNLEAEFTLTPKAGSTFAGGSTTAITGITTKADGSIVIPANLAAGNSYILTETKTPSGYVTLASGITFKVNADGTADITAPAGADAYAAMDTAKTTVQVTNEENHFQIEKRSDQSGTPLLGGASLEIRDADDKAVRSWTSSKDEAQDITNLAAGSYRLVETKTVDGYLVADSIAFTLADDNTITVAQADAGKLSGDKVNGFVLTMTDRKIFGQVELTKKLEGSTTTLANITFNLCKQDGTVLVTGLQTDKDGKWNSTQAAKELPLGLDAGEYYFIETATTDDVVLDATTKYPFTITGTTHYADTKTFVPVTAQDTYVNANFKFKKTDATSKDALGGVVFELKDADGKLVTTVTTAKAAYEATYKGTKDEAKTESVAVGEAFISGLGRGTYTLTEKTPLAGYKDEGRSYTFTVTDADAGKILTVEDSTLANTRKTGTVTITKVDSEDSDALLDGVSFKLEKENEATNPFDKLLQFVTGNKYDTIEAEATPDASGKLTISGLAWGKYKLTEILPKDGYINGDEVGKDAPVYEFEIGSDGVTATLVYDQTVIKNAQTNITVLKTDENGNVIEGANLEITGEKFADASTTSIKWTSALTAERIKKQLVTGVEYTLKETDRTIGYEAFTGNVKFKLEQNGQITITENAKLTDGKDAASLNDTKTQLILRNVKVYGSAELTKYETDGETPIMGATFAVYTKDGKEMERNLKSNEQGIVKTTVALPEGEYYFQETATLEDHVFGATPVPFTIKETNGMVATVSMTNEKLVYNVSLTKVDADHGNMLIPNTEFTLYKKGAEDWEVVKTDKTDDKGALSFTIGEAGTYKVTETAAANYIYDAATAFTKEFTVENTMDYHGKTLTIAPIANRRNTGSVTLTKVDAKDTAKTLAGATFVITDADGKQIGTEKVSGADGKITFDKLFFGDSYTLTEMNAPEGYLLPENPSKTFTLSDSQTTIDFGNWANTPTEFAFNKVVKDQEACGPNADSTAALMGAEFTLYTDVDCTNSIAASTSDENGKVSFDHVPVGTYYMKETKVPASSLDGTTTYIQMDETVKPVVIAEDGNVTIDGTAVEQIENIENDLARATIQINKVDEKNPTNPIADSTYGLYRLAGAEVPLYTGTEAASRSVISLASDEAPEELLIATAKTGADGILRFEGILAGVKYTIRELIAPSGSEVSEQPIQITFGVKENEDGTTTTEITSFEDGKGTAEIDPETGEIIWFEPSTQAMFYKNDEAGNMLAGATMRITDKDGNRVEGVDDWVSSAAEGHLVYGLLTAGETYILQEVSAPAGYELAEPITFTMSDKAVGPDEDYIQEWTMVDKKTPTTPKVPTTPVTPATPVKSTVSTVNAVKTGDETDWALWFALMALAGCSMIAGISWKKKSRNSK